MCSWLLRKPQVQFHPILIVDVDYNVMCQLWYDASLNDFLIQMPYSEVEQ